jgi:hypothetical protein
LVTLFRNHSNIGAETCQALSRAKMEVPTTIFCSKGEKTMTGNLILSGFQVTGNPFRSFFRSQPIRRENLHTLWLHPDRLPRHAAQTPVVQRTLDLLGPLDWTHFPERNLQHHWCQPAISYAAFAAACLLKLNEGLESMGDLHRYLVEHPASYPCSASLNLVPKPISRRAVCRPPVT